MRKAVFEKFDQLLYNFGLYSNEKPEKNNEKAIICPSCSSEYFILKETQYFTCHKCQIPYCSNDKCLGEWKKHQGKTCEAFVKEKKKRERTLTPSFLNSNNLKQCPVCGSIIEKFGNCNLVRCCSVRCQKKTLFCFVCLEVLSEKNSLQHFSQNSSFGKCVNAKNDENKGKNNMEEEEQGKNRSFEEEKEKKKEEINIKQNKKDDDYERIGLEDIVEKNMDCTHPILAQIESEKDNYTCNDCELKIIVRESPLA